MPVVGSIWLSTVSSVPVASLRSAGAVVGLDRQRARRARSFASTGGRLSSGMVKTTAIGLQLGDHHQAVGVAGVHHVAGVDQAQAEAAADRRGDAA